MKVSVLGTGYVGITVACLADFGHDVTLIGRTEDKAKMINAGTSPIYEPGLDEILKRNVDRGLLRATTSYDSMADADAIFICVGTPSRDDGSIDLSQVEDVSNTIGQYLKDAKNYKIVVVKSTVVPNTTLGFVTPILEKVSGKKAGVDFGVCMNPEFLREGCGVFDFMNPDKIVIGGIDEKSIKTLGDLYSRFDSKVPRVETDLTTAEMIKYAQNSMLAARISFMNEMAKICERIGADVKDVSYAIGLDSRIGPKFLNAGAGFGGSCFPKDVKALVSTAKSFGIEPKMLNATLQTNEDMAEHVVKLVNDSLGNVSGKKIAVLGLAFKSDTDDMRESRAVPVIRKLLSLGASIKAYDPKATENAKQILGDSIVYSASMDDCVSGTDACVIMTEWDEFKKLDLSKIRSPIIDGRRIINPEDALKRGVAYKGIGRGSR